MPLFTTKDLLRFERVASQYKLQIKSKQYLYKKWASGRTWDSIEPYANETAAGELEVGLHSSSPIAVNTLETGRAPGRIPYGFDKILYDWSIDKGIGFASSADRMKFARAVAFTIKRDGTHQFRAARNTDIFSDMRPTYETKIVDLVKKFTTAKVKSVISFL